MIGWWPHWRWFFEDDRTSRGQEENDANNPKATSRTPRTNMVQLTAVDRPTAAWYGCASTWDFPMLITVISDF
jgi:hypothetical protein